MVIMSQKRENWNHFVSRGTSFRWFLDILEENGNGEEIIDEIHTVDDYDEDENDEYDDN